MFKKKSLLFLVSMILLLTVVVGSTLAIIFVKTDDIMNIFHPQAPTGDLQITKTVEHPFGTNYAIPGSLSFKFKVNLGTELAGKTYKSTAGDLTVAADGTVELSAKPGQRVDIYDIPSKTKVVVTEVNIPAGFAPQGGAKQEVTIPLRNSVGVAFKNIYTPKKAPVNVTLDGIKELEGRDWQAGDSFTFALSHMENGQWQELGTKTVTYDAQNADFNKFSFTDLLKAYAFDALGTYSFRISEVKGTIGGIDYENQDKTVSYVDVTVTDKDMDGALEISKVTAGKNAKVTESGGVYAVAVTIRNTYAPAGTAKVTVQIKKTLEDKNGTGRLPAGFVFTLTDKDNNVITSAPTGAAGETAIELTFKAIDAGKQFVYTLQETDPNEPGLTCDPTKHTIVVDVIDNLDGTIRAEIYKQGASAPHSALCAVDFANTYDSKDTFTVITAKKELDGRKLKAEEFLFELYESADGVNIPQNAVPLQAKNAADGTVTFPKIDYDKVGVYRYVLLENETAPLGGVVYDCTRYYATVTVTDEKGELKAQTVITDAHGKTCEAVWRNTYDAIDCWLDIVAKKTLEGGQLQNKQFNFLVFEADEQMNYDPAKPVGDAKNDADGKIAFQRITFSKTGTYRFVLVEDTKNLPAGMTADGSVYGITVKVTDAGKGELKAQIDYTKKVTVKNPQGVETVQWQKLEELKFTNTYKAPPTEPTKPSETPKTGDESNPALLIALVIGSAVVLAVLIFLLLRERKKKD